MDERHRSDSLDAFQSRDDSDTHDLDLTPLHESGMTHTFPNVSRERGSSGHLQVGSEADFILIAHPEGKRLGSRFRLSPGTTMEIGRSGIVGVSLPEVVSISRKHARLRYIGSVVTIEDLGSTNGTYINDQPIHGRTVLRSGDRIQTAAVHFKFLHEQDVESAYHLAIYDLVAKDGLTEIFNKRKLDEELQREFARAVRHRRPLSLIAFDLDEFKTVNDTYGHLCGDFILKQVASLARDLVGPEQVFARAGGDEFVILAPETGAAGAQSLAAEIQDRIASYDHRSGNIKITVTCSFGVAELAKDMTNPNELYQAADDALLLAKRSGRNRVAVRS